MIVVPDIAERHDLNRWLDNLTTYLHLFTNDLVPDADTVLADFVEPDWDDYEPVRVTTWTPALTVEGRAVSYADPVLWTRGTGGVATAGYGYYVTDAVDGPLCWCERRLPGPVQMEGPTDAVVIRPRVTLREDPEPE